jgi:hypothetical protein
MKRIHALTLAVVVGLSACAPAPVQVKTSQEDPATWRNRAIWTEKRGDAVYVMAVGSAGNASLDRSMSLDSAEQDARERLAIYLGATVEAFRERMTRRREVAGRASDKEKTSSSEQTSQTDRGGRTIAEQAVRGVEIVNSTVEKDTDTLFVLARLDFNAFRSVLAADRALSEAERALVAKDASEVRSELDAALADARRQAK